MNKLTLDQFCDLWAKDIRQKQWHSILAKNAEDFATVAGEYALSCFRASFDQGGFYGSGTKWAPRESKWGKKLGSYSAFGKRDYRRRYGYDIWTDEKSVPIKGKRGKKRGRYQNYAAVHNTDPKFGLYTVNQYSSRRPVHRQFIGHSPKVLEHINSVLTPTIFKGFPHT